MLSGKNMFFVRLIKGCLSITSDQSISFFCFLICVYVIYTYKKEHVNDPSAGSPTETLLRLLLPLNGKI